MNILDILILAMLAFSLCAGMYKGFLSSLLASAGLVGAWFGAQAVYERVAAVALNNHSLIAALNNYLEPGSFFADGGGTLVSSLGGNMAEIQKIAEEAGQKVPMLKTAFENNLIGQAFQNLNLSSVADYFGQTLWESLFHVLAFVLSFIVIYFLILLVLNLLDHVINFPVLKAADWLVGGVFGLIRGAVFVLLLLTIALPLLQLAAPEFVASLTEGSRLYAMVLRLDFLKVGDTIQKLIGAAS